MIKGWSLSEKFLNCYHPVEVNKRIQKTHFQTATMVALLLVILPVVAWSDSPTAPFSDGSVMNVDFEDYLDGGVGFLNAGIRQLGDPFTNIKQKETAILNDCRFAYEGNRCGHAFTDQPDQRGQILFQRRFDAPEVKDEVAEFIYRAVADKPVDITGFVVWSTNGYRSDQVGLTLTARGLALSGRYDLIVDSNVGQESEKSPALSGLDQSQWIRIVLSRISLDKSVDLWVGPPGEEKWIGRYPDSDPNTCIGRIRVGDIHDSKSIGSGYWDNIRVGNARKTDEPVSPHESIRKVAEEYPTISYPIHVGTEKQLFVDDAVIDATGNLERTFHNAEKYPANPLMVPKEPWETGGTFFVPYDVIRESDREKLRVWYGAYRKSKNKLTYTCLAESTDGLVWTRPILGLFQYEGSKENNIVWQGRVVRPDFDPRDPDPSRRYKGMTRSDGFTPMFSPNGVHWTAGPAPTIQQAYDASSFHWNPVEERWIASCKIFRDGKRARGYAESKDFKIWSDTYPMLMADSLDHPKDELYALRIFRYESIFLGLLKIYHTQTDRCDLQLIVSRNAKSWQRPYRSPFLANSTEPGSYDYGNLDESGEPVRMGDELWFYYGGRSILHNEKPVETNGSLNLATLRLDGFTSLDAGEEEGILLTKPLLLEGKSLYVNAAVKGGEMLAEILEDKPGIPPGQLPVLASFTKAACTPVTVDSVRQRISWQGEPTFDQIRGKTVRLRFHLHKAALYSFWTEDLTPQAPLSH